MKGLEIEKIESLAKFSADKYNKIPIGDSSGLLRLLCFEPWQNVPLHKHPNGDEYFYVVKGKGRITVDKEEKEVEASGIVKAPAGVLHQWKNGPERLVLLSIIIPPKSYEYAEEATGMQFT